MFYLISTLNFGIPPVLVFQLVFNVDRVLTGLTAQQKGTTARWYSNKISLHRIVAPERNLSSQLKYSKWNYNAMGLPKCLLVTKISN